MDRQSISWRSYWRLVKGNRNFRRLWIAQIVSETGDWFYMVALYAMLLEFTGRAESLGVAFVMQVLPQALTGPFAGAINDRLRRKHVMIATDLSRAVIVGCMLLVRSPAMIWLVYPLLFSETVMWGLFEPARTAIIPNIVGEDEVIVANTLASSTWSMNLFLGSAIGGVAAVWLGREAIFALDSASFVVSALLIFGMRFAEPHAEAGGPLRWREVIDYSPIAEGVRYVRRERLSSLLLVKAGIGVAGASWVIFPVLGKDVFPIGSPGTERATLLGMSALMGARGLGSLLGPLLGGPWAQQIGRRLLAGIVAGFVLDGIGYIALAAVHAPMAAYALILVSHAGGAIVWVFSTTLLQLRTDDRFRGRIFAAELACCTTIMAASAYAAGAALDAGFGIRRLLVATGAFILIFVAGWSAFALRNGPRSTVRVGSGEGSS